MAALYRAIALVTPGVLFGLALCLSVVTGCGSDRKDLIEPSTSAKAGQAPLGVSAGVMPVAVDIKPNSCPNPFNPKSRGVLPVAIIGMPDFDVADIDFSSIRLEGVVAPLRCSIEDVAAAPVPEPQIPNLEIVSFTGPSSAIRGGVIGGMISLRIRNSGPVDVNSWFFVGFYISTDPVITTADRLLVGGRESVQSILAGQEKAVPLYSGARVATDSPAGNVYLGVIIDEFNAVAESDETDNTAALPITITGSGDVSFKLDPEGHSNTSAAIQAEECDCYSDGPDGIDDLTLKFRTQDVVDVLGALSRGESVQLTITGQLLDGTSFEGVDCVVGVGIADRNNEPNLGRSSNLGN